MTDEENLPRRLYVVTYTQYYGRTVVSDSQWSTVTPKGLEKVADFFVLRPEEVELYPTMDPVPVRYNRGKDVGKMHNGEAARVTEYERVEKGTDKKD